VILSAWARAFRDRGRAGAMRRVRLGMLLGLFLLPVAGSAQSVAPSASPQPSAGIQKLEAAMAGFSARSIELLAASSSPRERWIAGLMLLRDAMNGAATPAAADAQASRGRALLQQALKDGADDSTLLFWGLLDPPLRAQGDPAVQAQEILRMASRLQALEPENAAVWLGSLPLRDQPGAIPAAVELLHKAAQGKRFDTHFATSMRVLLKAFDKVPASADWPKLDDLPAWQRIKPDDVPVIMAIGVASSQAMPYLVAIEWWCGGNSGEHPWLNDCRKLAQLMVDTSDSIVPRSLGLALLGSLYDANSEIGKRALEQRRELAWLMENGLQRVGPGAAVGFDVWRKAWNQADSTEVSVARALVKAQGLALTPPADFVPAWDRETPPN
jgi:hypothetical protein